MRLWSIHPKYLDKAGLLAVWRESLLAKKVLEKKTVGYKNHPQLLRFKNTKNPISTINTYLYFVFEESGRRNYKFDKKKIGKTNKKFFLKTNDGQIKYEMEHLKNKLRKRDIKKYKEIKSLKKLEPHPLFKIITGKIESWEKIKNY